MTKHKYLNIFLALLVSINCYGQEPAKESSIKLVVTSTKPICGATSFEDTSKIIKNPGNCPIEILRRIGRILSQNWPENKNTLRCGTVLFNEFIGTPAFIKHINLENLSKEQQESCNKMLDNHIEAIDNLAKEFPAASEAITIRTVVATEGIISNIKDLVNFKESSASSMKQSEIDQLKENTLPFLEKIKDVYGLFTLSEKGIFSRSVIETKETDFQELLCLNNLTIGKYIDDEPLITLAQTHQLKDTAETMKRLETFPNMVFIKQTVASAGLDFEKDLLCNHAHESILYINLTPTGEKMIPDIRWVGLIPEPEKLVAILPKLKNLCVQLGIFITTAESDVPNASIIKLSHFMVPQYGVYAALADKFCILTSTPEGASKALKHLMSVNSSTVGKEFKNCNLYCHVKTSDLNIQLQQFLQSPLMANQGIPPISNLTIFKDMEDIEACTDMTASAAKIILNIPFKTKKEK